MHDVVSCEYLECFKQLFYKLPYFILTEFSIPFDLLAKSASIAELIKEVKIVDCFKYLDESYYIGWLYFIQHFDLVKSAFLQFRIIFESLYIDHFHCYFFPRLAINPSVYFSVLSFPDLFMKGVVLNDFYHPLIICSIIK